MVSVLWQSSILLAAVGLLAWTLRRRRPAVRHVLWAGAVLAVPMIPLLGWLVSTTGALPSAEIRVMPRYSAPSEPKQPAESLTALPPVAPDATDRAPTVPGGRGPHEAFDGPLASGAELAPDPAQPPLPSKTSPTPEEPDPSRESLSILSYPWALVFLGYAIGVAVFLVLVAVGRARLACWVRRGHVVTNPRTLDIFQAAADQLGLARDVIVVESPQAHSPMTIGTMNPVVLLPCDITSGFSEQELFSIAVHELAHVKRLDSLWLTLLSLIRAVLFFHPLVWVACRQVSLLADSACDDAVLDATGEPVSYAKMLTRLAEGLPRGAWMTELASGIVLSESAFLRRIKAILSNRRGQFRRLSRIALAITVLAATVSLALALMLPVAERADRNDGPAAGHTGGSGDETNTNRIGAGKATTRPATQPVKKTGVSSVEAKFKKLCIIGEIQTSDFDTYLQYKRSGRIAQEETEGNWVYFAVVKDHVSGIPETYLRWRESYKARLPMRIGVLRAKVMRVFSQFEPPPLYSSSLVYDSDRRCLVLFGRCDGGGHQTWEFRQNIWGQMTLDVSPSADEMFSMVYDPKNRRVVLFGGHKASEWPKTLDETWAYRNSQWRKLKSAKGPNSRRGSRILACDRAAGTVVLFGGYTHRGTSYSFFNDTWVLDGSKWQSVKPAGPPPNSQTQQRLFSSQGGVIASVGNGAHYALKQTKWSKLPAGVFPEEEQNDHNFQVPFFFYEGEGYKVFLKKGLWIQKGKEGWKRVELNESWTNTGAWGSKTIAWDSHAKLIYFFADQRDKLITSHEGIEEGLERIPSSFWVVDLSYLLDGDSAPLADKRQKRLVKMLETDEYKQLIGKTVHDVTSLLGAPDKTNLDSDRSGWLTYISMIARALDLKIENGKVTKAYQEGIPMAPPGPIDPYD